MTEAELISQCQAHAVWYSEGEHDGKPGWFLRWAASYTPEDKADSFVERDNLESLTWGQIYRHVVNGRDVKRVTRVVGYFSSVHNWNPSKVVELKDRRRGDYAP